MANETTILRVEGMTCNGCAALVKSVLEDDGDGVQQADVDLEQGAVTVQYDPNRINRETMADLIRGAGYTPVLAAGS